MNRFTVANPNSDPSVTTRTGEGKTPIQVETTTKATTEIKADTITDRLTTTAVITEEICTMIKLSSKKCQLGT